MRAKEDVHDLVEASKKLVDLEVVNVDVVAILEVLDRVSSAVELFSSRPDREIPKYFDVVMLEPKRAYGRFEHRNLVVGVTISAAREGRDGDDLLAGDLLPI